MTTRPYTFNHPVSGSRRTDTNFTPPHPYKRNLQKLLLFLAFLGCLSACQPERFTENPNEPNQISPAAAEGDTLCASLLEQVGRWNVVAILKTDGIFRYDISTDGTEVYFANNEVTFFVSVISVSFDDGTTTIESDVHGPYEVEYTSSNTLTIANVHFRLSSSNGVYNLTSRDIEIQIR